MGAEKRNARLPNRALIFLFLGILLNVSSLITLILYLLITRVTTSLSLTEIIPTFIIVVVLNISGIALIIMFWKRWKCLVYLALLLCIVSTLLTLETLVLTGTHVLQPMVHMKSCVQKEPLVCVCHSPFERNVLHLKYLTSEYAVYTYENIANCNDIQTTLFHFICGIVFTSTVAFIISIISTVFVGLVLRMKHHRTNEKREAANHVDDSVVFTLSDRDTEQGTLQSELPSITPPKAVANEYIPFNDFLNDYQIRDISALKNSALLQMSTVEANPEGSELMMLRKLYHRYSDKVKNDKIQEGKTQNFEKYPNDSYIQASVRNDKNQLDDANSRTDKCITCSPQLHVPDKNIDPTSHIIVRNCKSTPPDKSFQDDKSADNYDFKSRINDVMVTTKPPISKPLQNIICRSHTSGYGDINDHQFWSEKSPKTKEYTSEIFPRVHYKMGNIQFFRNKPKHLNRNNSIESLTRNYNNSNISSCNRSESFSGKHSYPDNWDHHSRGLASTNKTSDEHKSTNNRSLPDLCNQPNQCISPAVKLSFETDVLSGNVPHDRCIPPDNIRVSPYDPRHWEDDSVCHSSPRYLPNVSNNNQILIYPEILSHEAQQRIENNINILTDENKFNYSVMHPSSPGIKPISNLNVLTHYPGNVSSPLSNRKEMSNMSPPIVYHYGQTVIVTNEEDGSIAMETDI